MLFLLKNNQKFGRKGGGKCIPKIIVKLLKPCFHSGNHDKSQRFTPEDMHKELLPAILNFLLMKSLKWKLYIIGFLASS